MLHLTVERGRQKTSGVQLIRSVAIYARVSTVDQTCDRQVADLNVLAMRCAYKVVGVFEETASGTSGKRKVRQQVIDLAQARRIDAILVTELSQHPARAHDDNLLAGIAQFERDLLSERAKSGLAAARKRGKKLGRQKGQRPVSDKVAPKVIQAAKEGRSYRWIARDLQISKKAYAFCSDPINIL